MELLHSVLWFTGAAAGVLGMLALVGGAFAIASLERDDSSSADGIRA